MKAPGRRPHPRLVEFLERLAAELPDVQRRPMFGAPALFAGGRMFACAYGNRLGLKVPADLAERLRREGDVGDFRPEGRPRMREWIALSPARVLRGEDAAAIARTSFAFVANGDRRTKASRAGRATSRGRST